MLVRVVFIDGFHFIAIYFHSVSDKDLVTMPINWCDSSMLKIYFTKLWQQRSWTYSKGAYWPIADLFMQKIFLKSTGLAVFESQDLYVYPPALTQHKSNTKWLLANTCPTSDQHRIIPRRNLTTVTLWCHLTKHGQNMFYYGQNHELTW